VHGIATKPPLAWKATEALLRTTLGAPLPANAVQDWLDANAPHTYHSGLTTLWEDFRDDHEDLLEDGGTAEDWKRFMATWLPMKAGAGQAGAPAKQVPAAKAATKKAPVAKQAPAKKQAPATKRPAPQTQAAKTPATKTQVAKSPAAKVPSAKVARTAAKQEAPPKQAVRKATGNQTGASQAVECTR
jgi:hypothetical protein